MYTNRPGVQVSERRSSPASHLCQVCDLLLNVLVGSSLDFNLFIKSRENLSQSISLPQSLRKATYRMQSHRNFHSDTDQALCLELQCESPSPQVCTYLLCLRPGHCYNAPDAFGNRLLRHNHKRLSVAGVLEVPEERRGPVSTGGSLLKPQH